LATVIVAVEALPVIETAVPAPLSNIPVILPVVLTWLPVATAVTSSEKEHDPEPARPNPERLMMLPPACAVTVPWFITPPSLVKQLPPRLLGEAITRPLGKISEKARFESVPVLFGLVMVNASEAVPLMGMLDAPKLFTSTGGAITEIDAAAVLPVPPLLELTVLVMFMYCPAAPPVTVTLKVQLPLAAI